MHPKRRFEHGRLGVNLPTLHCVLQGIGEVVGVDGDGRRVARGRNGFRLLHVARRDRVQGGGGQRPRLSAGRPDSFGQQVDRVAFLGGCDDLNRCRSPRKRVGSDRRANSSGKIGGVLNEKASELVRRFGETRHEGSQSRSVPTLNEDLPGHLPRSPAQMRENFHQGGVGGDAALAR